jgi:hypothetical protein
MLLLNNLIGFWTINAYQNGYLKNLDYCFSLYLLPESDSFLKKSC